MPCCLCCENIETKSNQTISDSSSNSSFSFEINTQEDKKSLDIEFNNQDEKVRRHRS